MMMRLISINDDRAVFGPEPADPNISNEEVLRDGTGLPWQTFRRLGTSRIEKSEFEAKIKDEQFPDIADEFVETIGPRDPNSGVGFGDRQPQPGSRFAAQVKDQMAKEAEKKKK